MTVSPAHEGGKATLPPNEPDGPDGHTDQGGGYDEPENGSEHCRDPKCPCRGENPDEPADLAELLAIYRGRPEPFLAGTFALYSAASGAVVMVTEIPGRGVEQRDMPSKMVKLAIAAMSGKGPLGKLFGRG